MKKCAARSIRIRMVAMPGLDAAQATAAWLWDHRVAAIAADNPAVEALPVEPGIRFQHRRLIALQGMPLGELWDLDELAYECANGGVYEFMLVSAPLYIPGGRRIARQHLNDQVTDRYPIVSGP